MSNRNRAPSPTTEENRVLLSKGKIHQFSEEYNQLGLQLKSLLEKKGNTILSKAPKIEKKESILSGRKEITSEKFDKLQESHDQDIRRAEELKQKLYSDACLTRQRAMEKAKERYDEYVRFAEVAFDKAESFINSQYDSMIGRCNREYNSKKSNLEIKDKTITIELSNIEKEKEIVSPTLQKQLYDTWIDMKNIRVRLEMEMSAQNVRYPIPDLPERPCDPPPIPAIPQMISPDVADFFSTLGNENAISAEERRKAQDEERRIREASDKEYEERMMKIAMDAKKRDQEELERRRAINKRRAEEIQEPPPATEEIGVAVNLYRRKREVTIGDD